MPISARAGYPERRGDRLEPVPSTPQTQRHHSDDTGSTETRQLLHAVQAAKASASSLESSLGSAATWSRAQMEVLLFAARARRTAQEVGGDARKNDILTGRVSPKLALETTKEEGS